MKISSILQSLLSPVFFIAISTYADHGPGTSGSGFTTLTAETLRAGQFASSVQFDWTEFKGMSGNVEGIDLLDRSYLSTVTLSYGLIDNFQIGMTYGYYAAEGNRELENGDVVTFDPDGFTDLWVTGKYRFYQGPAGQFAFIGGVKLPVGDSSLTNSDGERVEPSATAGTGAWDGLAGMAYTIPLSSSVTLDSSALYTFRGERYNYRLGNRLDMGTSVAWRVCGDATTFPQVSLVAEATLRHIAKSEDDGEKDGNTGGTVLFLSPGVKVSFTEKIAANLGIQVPVSQNLNGRQAETDFRLITGLSVAF
jgi:hypothetical protein